MSFREIEKERLGLETPPEIATLVREKAARERTSISAVVTELLCVALDRDPAKFGITARTSAASN